MAVADASGHAALWSELVGTERPASVEQEHDLVEVAFAGGTPPDVAMHARLGYERPWSNTYWWLDAWHRRFGIEVTSAQPRHVMLRFARPVLGSEHAAFAAAIDGTLEHVEDALREEVHDGLLRYLREDRSSSDGQVVVEQLATRQPIYFGLP